MATYESQKRATAKWKKKNKTKTALYQAKSRGKNYILKHANEEDLNQFEEWIKERRKELRKD